VVDYYESGKELPGYIKAGMCLSCEEASALPNLHAVKQRNQRCKKTSVSAGSWAVSMSVTRTKRSKVRLCGICGGRSGTGAVSLRVLRFRLLMFFSLTVPCSLMILSSTLYNLDTDSFVK
jgi:hypothetical protein